MKDKKTSTYPVLEEDAPEFIGQIIDIFEDFLEEKRISIPNPEREQDETDEENSAILYGSDYGNLAQDIRETLQNWHIIKPEE